MFDSYDDKYIKNVFAFLRLLLFLNTIENLTADLMGLRKC